MFCLFISLIITLNISFSVHIKLPSCFEQVYITFMNSPGLIPLLTFWVQELYQYTHCATGLIPLLTLQWKPCFLCIDWEMALCCQTVSPLVLTDVTCPFSIPGDFMTATGTILVLTWPKVRFRNSGQVMGDWVTCG